MEMGNGAAQLPVAQQDQSSFEYRLHNVVDPLGRS